MFYIYFSKFQRYEYGFTQQSTAEFFAKIHNFQNYTIKKI